MADGTFAAVGCHLQSCMLKAFAPYYNRKAIGKRFSMWRTSHHMVQLALPQLYPAKIVSHMPFLQDPFQRRLFPPTAIRKRTAVFRGVTAVAQAQRTGASKNVDQPARPSLERLCFVPRGVAPSEPLPSWEKRMSSHCDLLFPSDCRTETFHK